MFEKPAISVRIYLVLNATPMADIRMNDGVVEHIQWNDARARKQFEFENAINGYTLFYD